MSDKELQGATPVTEAAQGAEKPVTVTETTTPKVETTPQPQPVPQSEWQKVQEQIREQNKRLAEAERKQFEKENPIVLNDKYKEKWSLLMTQKNDPNHKYHYLDHEELLRIMRDPVEPVARPLPQAVTVPSFNPSVSPDLPPGAMSQETRDFLRLRYTDEEIKAAERA